MTKRLFYGIWIGLAALCVSLPAVAGEVYSWRTEDGGFHFTDSAKNVPARYREQALKRSGEKLSGYAHYTAQDSNASTRYEQSLTDRLAYLRAINAEPYRVSAADVHSGAGQTVSLRAGGALAPAIDLDTRADAGPVIIERLRMKPLDQITTRHNLVVRQDGKVLAIVKGKISGEINAAGNIEDEADFE